MKILASYKKEAVIYADCVKFTALSFRSAIRLTLQEVEFSIMLLHLLLIIQQSIAEQSDRYFFQSYYSFPILSADREVLKSKRRVVMLQMVFMKLSRYYAIGL